MAADKISRTEDGTTIVAADGTEWIVAKIDGKRGFRLFEHAPGASNPDLTDKDDRPFMWVYDFDTRKEAVTWVIGESDPKENPSVEEVLTTNVALAGRLKF